MSKLDTLDWTRITADLDARGHAVAASLLTPAQCQALAAAYGDDERYRSRIVMSRHGFGRGEYKYFAYPLPKLLHNLRTALYPRLAPIANRWNKQMGIAVQYPDDHAAFLARCHQAGADPAVRPRRLQLPAPGPVWRTRVSAAGGRAAVATGRRLHRR